MWLLRSHCHFLVFQAPEQECINIQEFRKRHAIHHKTKTMSRSLSSITCCCSDSRPVLPSEHFLAFGIMYQKRAFSFFFFLDLLDVVCFYYFNRPWTIKALKLAETQQLLERGWLSGHGRIHFIMKLRLINYSLIIAGHHPGIRDKLLNYYLRLQAQVEITPKMINIWKIKSKELWSGAIHTDSVMSSSQEGFFTRLWRILTNQVWGPARAINHLKNCSRGAFGVPGFYGSMWASV